MGKEGSPVNRRSRTTLLLLILLLASLGAMVAWAGSSTHVDLFWQVLSGGGAPAASGSSRIALNGSIGQATIGVSSSTGGDTLLRSGYWPGTAEAGWEVLLPIIIRAP
jgi:hypothetical protein